MDRMFPWVLSPLTKIPPVTVTWRSLQPPIWPQADFFSWRSPSRSLDSQSRGRREHAVLWRPKEPKQQICETNNFWTLWNLNPKTRHTCSSKYHDPASFKLYLVTVQLLFPHVESSQLRPRLRVACAILGVWDVLLHGLPFNLQGSKQQVEELLKLQQQPFTN